MTIELSDKEVKELLTMIGDETHLADLWPVIKVLERKLKMVDTRKEPKKSGLIKTNIYKTHKELYGESFKERVRSKL